MVQRVTTQNGTVLEFTPEGVKVIAPAVPAPAPSRPDEAALAKLRELRKSELPEGPPAHRFLDGDIVNAGLCPAFENPPFEDRPWLALVCAVDHDDPGSDLIIRWYDSRGTLRYEGWFAGAKATLVEPWLPGDGGAAEAERELPEWARPGPRGA